MPKKYIQLLLSINFCLTAVATATGSDADSDDSFVVIPDPDPEITKAADTYYADEEHNWEMDTHPEEASQDQASNIMPSAELRDSFHGIWLCFDEISKIHPSQFLRNTIEYYQELSKKPVASEGSHVENSTNLKELIHSNFDSIQRISDNLLTEDLNENSKNTIGAQFANINMFLNGIAMLLQDPHLLPKKDLVYLDFQLRQFSTFLNNFEESQQIKNVNGNDILPAGNPLIENEVSQTPPEVHVSNIELRDLLYHIWHRLEKINEIYPSSLLQEAISQHQENSKKPILYDEKLLDRMFDKESLAEDVTSQFKNIDSNWQKLLGLLLTEDLDKNGKNVINIELSKIRSSLGVIRDGFQALSKRDLFFLKVQLEELSTFFYDFAEGLRSNSSTGSDIPPTNNLSPMWILLKKEFNQIWDCLNEVNTIHQSEPLQRLIFHHRNTEIPYNENLEEVNGKTLENQFTQLYKSLETCSQYQPKEELDEESRAKLDIQLDRIKRCLATIYEIYDSEKESLSKKERAFLRDQLEDLDRFSYDFIAPSPLQTEAGLHSLDSIEALLDSYKEEDSLIYPQYEYIINSQEANISDLLTSSQTQNAIENQFLYFNKDEGLIEIQHTELPEDGEYIEPYTTTWKIRPADTNLVTGWRENDPITIDKAAFYEKYTMRGEKLDYTLTNHNKVRANFVCKSSNKNTYTILSIDYLENIVVLKNGPCLFVQDGDLKEWHTKDIVVLQRFGSVTDTNNSHKLINKTRGSKEAWVFLKRKF